MSSANVELTALKQGGKKKDSLMQPKLNHQYLIDQNKNYRKFYTIVIAITGLWTIAYVVHSIGSLDKQILVSKRNKRK